MISLTACGANIEQTADSLTVELGSKVNINISDYFTSDKQEVLSEFMIDTTAVNTDAVGNYNIIVGYEDKRYNIYVTVEDTTAPVITLKELGTYNEEDIVKIEDIVEVSDLSEYTVAFLVENEKVDEVTVLEEATEFQIIAEDIHGNTIKETVIFEMQDIQDQAEAEDPFNEEAYEKEQAEKIAEAEKAALEMLEQWAQGQNKDDNSNNSGNNGGGNTSSSQNNGGGSSNNGGGSNNSGKQNQGGGSTEDGNYTDSSDAGFGSIDVDATKDDTDWDSIGKGTIGG